MLAARAHVLVNTLAFTTAFLNAVLMLEVM
jgi:hypothetical protein